MTNIQTVSTTVQVADPSASCDFFVTYFNAKIAFNCCLYIDVAVNDHHLAFKKAKSPENIVTKGITFNIEVDDVDREYQRLIHEIGLKPTESLEDHVWGDRGFGITDPNGIHVYIYSSIEPSEEFKACYK